MGTVFSCLLVIIYAFAFQQKYQNFSISNTLLRQKLYIDIERDYYKEIDFPYSGKIDELKGMGKGTWEIMEIVKADLGNTKSNEFHTLCVKANKWKVAKDTLKLFWSQKSDHFVPRYTLYSDNEYYGTVQAIYRWGYDGKIFSEPGRISKSYFEFSQNFLAPFSLGLSGMLAVLEIGYVMVSLFFKRRFLWAEMGMSVFILGTLILTFTGQCAEWGRTAIAVLPFSYCLIGINGGTILQKVNRGKT